MKTFLQKLHKRHLLIIFKINI